MSGPTGADPVFTPDGRRMQGRSWGPFGALTDFPNATVLPLTGDVQRIYTELQPGDTAFLTTTSTLYVCTSIGTLGGGDAVWVALGGGGSGGIVGPLTTVYVEPPTPLGRGDDATGVRGDASKPFATMAAAFAAMEDGDIMSMAEGAYVPAAIPIALVSGTISGAGQGLTIIDATGIGSALDFATTTTRLNWLVRGVSINAPDALANAYTADGTTATAQGFFVGGQLVFEDVLFLNGGKLAYYVSNVVERGCLDLSPSTADFYDSGCSLFNTKWISPSARGFNFAADRDDAQNPNGVGVAVSPLIIDSASLLNGQITLVPSGNPTIVTLEGSEIGDIICGKLTVSAANDCASFLLAGTGGSFVATGVNALPRVGTGATLSMTGMWNDVVNIEAGAAGNIRLTPRLTAQFLDLLIIGLGIDADLRAATFGDGIVYQVTTPTDGTVKPPDFSLAPKGAAATVSFVLPFTFFSTLYLVTCEVTAALQNARTTVKNVGDFDIADDAGVPAGTIGPLISYYGP